MYAEAAEKRIAKDQFWRFKRYLDVQNDLLAARKSLVRALFYEEGYERFRRIVKHAENLWDDACLLFLEHRYTTGLAISITCLEEIGKIGVARFELVIDEVKRQQGTLPPDPRDGPRGKHPFYSHRQKLLLAAGAGALVNARLDRILGLPQVVDFLDRVERGEIERLRQACLYVDTLNGDLSVPSECVGRADAEFHVILAGELLAEVAGFEPPEWKRLLAQVKNFERSIGHPHE
jgi:AbiV family abortive infection protein